MSYVDSTLGPGEKVVFRATLHWMLFAPGILLLPIVIGLFLLLRSVVTWKTTEMAITNKRVIMKRGAIRRRTLELNLGKVENVGVEQGLIGRMLNFGTITVVGTGGTREAFDWVANPLAFRRAVQDAAHG